MSRIERHSLTAGFVVHAILGAISASVTGLITTVVVVGVIGVIMAITVEIGVFD